MKKPLTLSIVIPVYNEERHLKACLDSIVAQSVKPNEVIIVDNNSSDNSLKIASEYPFIKVVSEKHQGIAYARNAGFNAVKSDIIGRIDADAILPSNWCEFMLAALNGKPDTLVTGGCYMYDLRIGQFTGWLTSQLAFRMNRLIMGHYIAFGSNMAFYKDAWDKVKSKTHNDPAIHEDLDLAIHLHRLNYKIDYRAGLKVGVDSRLSSTRTRETHMTYLKMWPRTLYLHGLKRAWLGWVGVYFVYCMYFPLIALNHLLDWLKRIK